MAYWYNKLLEHVFTYYKFIVSLYVSMVPCFAIEKKKKTVVIKIQMQNTIKYFGGFISALKSWKFPQKGHELNLTFGVFLHFNSQIKESTVRLLSRSGIVQRQNLKTASRLFTLYTLILLLTV